MKFNIGDKVRVKPFAELAKNAADRNHDDLKYFFTKPDGELDDLWFTDCMIKFCGKEAIVSSIEESGCIHLTGVDNPEELDEEWYFLEDWLEPFYISEAAPSYVSDFSGTIEENKKAELMEILEQIESLTEQARKLIME